MLLLQLEVGGGGVRSRYTFWAVPSPFFSAFFFFFFFFFFFCLHWGSFCFPPPPCPLQICNLRGVLGQMGRQQAEALGQYHMVSSICFHQFAQLGFKKRWCVGR